MQSFKGNSTKIDKILQKAQDEPLVDYPGVTVTRRRSVKKIVLKNTQNSPETISDRKTPVPESHF